VDRDEAARRGDDLVEKISSGFVGGPEGYELLQLVFSGYPIGRLEPLLDSGAVEVVRTGVSIVAEATASAGQLPPQIARLLGHPDVHVRYYAVQAISASGSAAPGRAGAQAAELIDDGERPVRRSVVRFLSGAPEDQLVAMVPHLGEEWHDRVPLLIGAGADRAAAAAIIEQLAASGADRLVGVAAAIRHAAIDRTPLEVAAGSSDPEIRDVAQHELAIDDERRARREADNSQG
jgi:hypothetical protein